jgi:formyl-CoA transferase
MAQRPRQVWLAALEAAGVPCAPINTIPELAADPQTAALGMLAPVPGTDYQLVPLPLSFQGQRPAITAPAPALGEYRLP